jgi:putative chitinase
MEDRNTGKVYYGRGFVQLTWAKNYQTIEKLTGYRLYETPDLALDPTIAAEILIKGMKLGSFTGKTLAMYFNDRVDDAEGARRIINGVDKAKLIASYHAQFHSAIKQADAASEVPADVKPEAAKADSPALSTDKTLIGTVTSVIGAGGAGVLGAIDNPWALAALVIVGFGVILFLTGRLEIRRKAGA